MRTLWLALLLTACFEQEDDDRPNPPGPQDRGQQGGDTGTAGDGGFEDGGFEDGGSGDGGFEDGGSGDGGSFDGGSGDGGQEADAAEACHPDILGWPEDWATLEEQVVELTNQARRQTQDCGSYGTYPPVADVEMDPYLRCAARYHSAWMAETGVFDHYSSGGDLGYSPWDRMAAAGFTGSGVGENIAAGYGSAAQVVQGWLDSDGHCANLMASSAVYIGVGYAEGGSYGTYWTQNFGR